MGRTAEPWYWEERKAYYVNIEGKRVRLDADKKKAYQKFHALMSGRREPAVFGAISVIDACEKLMGQVTHHRASTQRLYRDYLGPFGAHFRHRPLDSIKPPEVVRFFSDYKGTGYNNRPFGNSSRALMCRYVKLLYRWARDMGLIQINPMVSLENPWKIPPRQRGMTEEEYFAVMADRRLNDRFKEALEFMWRTGMRNGEVAALSARHLDAHRPIARFQPTEHKTGAKTGLQREVYFPPDLWARVQEYAELRPKGPLLRNMRGVPWTQELLSDTFHRVKQRLGLKCVMYQARHAFITNLLDNGTPLHLAAKMAGHTHPETIMRTYYHPDTGQMLNHVAAIESGNARLEEIKRKVAAERKRKRSVFLKKGARPDVEAG